MTDGKQQETPFPNPDLSTLSRLVGTWEVSGGATGTVTYEWMDGGFFLIQHVHLEQHGQNVEGIEIIGHLRPFGEEPGKDIRSRYYDTTGNTFDYVYELIDDKLIIWAGEKNSPAYYKGTFSTDSNVVSGDWIYPGGGGYTSSMTRVK